MKTSRRAPRPMDGDECGARAGLRAVGGVVHL